MYCVIQEIKLKKPDLKGHSKRIEPYEFTCMGNVYYKYIMSDERFERDIKKAYKISIHHSYRENGKVKKKQWVICTMGYYYIIDYGPWIGDCCRLEDKLETIGISEEELRDLVYSKLNPLVERIEKEYEQTEEYKTVKKNKEIIKKHMGSEREFNNKYGEGYDQCYDVFGELKNKDKLNEILENYKTREEYEERFKSSYYNNNYSNYDSYSSSGYSKNISSNYNEEEKKLLKKLYRKMSKEFHPDKNLNNQDEAQEMMVLINKLKEEWSI